VKTNFKIAWVDDNFSDEQMRGSTDRLTRQLRRKNGFALIVEDIFGESANGNFDEILGGLVSIVDFSNSIDLVVIDYELSDINDKSGKRLEGQDIAKRFRDALPSVDILFYSGKKTPDELRSILAKASVDCVNCVRRETLVDDAYTVIENVINRSCKISTLRGLVLNSVCEMDNMIVDILCKYADVDAAQNEQIKDKAARLITRTQVPSRIAALKRKSVKDLLTDKNMMSGKLLGVLEHIQNSLGLSNIQLDLVTKYRSDILDLRTSAAHSKETMCSNTSQAMLQFKSKEYRRSDIDDICKMIVIHERNIKSILDSMV
jgi:hypothetical protein